MRYEKALVMAVMAHQGQTRWNKQEPYVCHPIRVAAGVAAPMIGKFTPEFIEKHKIAAVLHDTVEDTHLTVEDIRKEFDDEIAEAVDHLTKRDGDKVGSAEESYDDFIERCSKNPMAVRIKIADLEDNSVGLKPDSPRAKKYAAALCRLRPLI